MREGRGKEGRKWGKEERKRWMSPPMSEADRHRYHLQRVEGQTYNKAICRQLYTAS